MGNNNPELERRRKQKSDRHTGLQTGRYLGVLQTRLTTIAAEIGSLTQQECEINGGHYPTIGGRAFSGTDKLYPVMQAFRKLPDPLAEGLRVNRELNLGLDKFLAELALANHYAKRVRGVSLQDVEGMSLPLAPEDIKSIDQAMYYSRFYNKEDLPVAQRMILLPVRSALGEWEEENPGTPPSLRPLRDRLVDYFDYYTSFFTGQIKPEEYMRFIISAWTRKQMLLMGLGGYIPARFGVTPSSATKLVYKQTELLIGRAWCSEFFVNRIAPFFAYSHQQQPRGLPQELYQYQFYDSKMDEKAANHILSFFPDQPTKGADIVFEDISRYLQPLNAFLKDRKHRTLEIDLPENSFCSSITLSRQNRHTLVILVRFNGDDHLLLEVAKNGYIFGLPAKVNIYHPEASLAFIQTLCSAVLPSIKKAVPISKAQPSYSRPIPEAPVLPDGLTTLPLKGEETTLPSKIWRGAKMVADVARGIETTPESFEPRRRVIYTVDQIKAFLGSGATDKEIRRIENHIRKYCLGGSADKPLKAADAADLRTIRSGYHRIIIHHQGNNTFTLEGIPARRDLDRVVDSLLGK